MDAKQLRYNLNIIREIYQKNTNKDLFICVIGGSASSVYTDFYLNQIGPISDIDVEIISDKDYESTFNDFYALFIFF